jgi:nitrite reductase (NADH) large subunit
MASPPLVMRPPGARVRWTVGRGMALLAVPVLLTWLLLDPANGLRFLWYVAIPILPATFFVSTRIWRGICPLATLNEIGNSLGRPRPLPAGTARWLAVGGLALFHLLVPARRFAFNEDGALLAITVVAVGGIAVTLGALFQVRSAFCNALCPVLPVELLYGQAPIARIERTRCASCSVCTPQGCLDLAETKAIPQLLGTARRTARWLATPYGAFFAALPGFIVGYNQVADGAPGTFGLVYATTLGWSLVSLAVVGLVVGVFRLDAARALPFLAAAAGGVYYWYAGPAIATQFAAPSLVAVAIQAIGIGLVAWWFGRAMDRGHGVRVSDGAASIR